MFNKVMQKLGEERSVIRETYEYGVARSKQVGAENVFDFSIGNPSAPSPQCVREEIERLIRETPAEVLHGYTSAAGAPDVRKAIADYVKNTFGVPLTPDLVYMTCGASSSLTIVLCALCEAGDEVIVLTPYFPEYKTYVERAGAKVVAVPTDENFRPDAEAVKNAVTVRTKAVILNSPNNPTGAVYTKEEIDALTAVLRKKSAEFGKPVFIVSDEPYRELTYGAEAPDVMSAYADTVVCYSFSKTLSLAGERIGYIAVHPACSGANDLFAAVCGAGRSLGYVCAPALFQRVCAKCIGKSSDVGIYKANRDLLYGALTDMGYSCALPEGAFYLFVKSPESDAKKFCERARKYELLLVPSDSFGVSGYARVSYCVTKAQIERSLPAFEKLAREYQL